MKHFKLFTQCALLKDTLHFHALCKYIPIRSALAPGPDAKTLKGPLRFYLGSMLAGLFFVMLCGMASLARAETQDAAQERQNLVLISTQLELAHYMQGQFQQQRTLKGFDRRLSSSGIFYFWRDQGLYWEVQKPFYRATTFKQRQVLSWSAPDVLSDTMSPNMIQRQIGKVLMAVLGTDIEMLSSVFATESTIAAASGDWSIRLTPKDIATRKMLKHLDISGKATLDKIIVVSAGGDESLIDFSAYVRASTPAVNQCKKFYPEDKGSICKPIK